MKSNHYECDACESIFEIKNSEDNILSPEFCPFCKEPLGESYEVDDDR